MTELISILKYDEEAKDRYDELEFCELISLPRHIESFTDYLTRLGEDETKEEFKQLNIYHVFNEVFQKFRLKAAIDYFRKHVKDLEITDERIKTAYERIAEDWISERETAEHEIEEFVYFVDLLK